MFPEKIDHLFNIFHIIVFSEISFVTLLVSKVLDIPYIIRMEDWSMKDCGGEIILRPINEICVRHGQCVR
jgi:hypothetical protein